MSSIAPAGPDTFIRRPNQVQNPRAGHKRGGKIPQRKHLIPFVGRTIRASLLRFRCGGRDRQSGTWNIQEDAADSTFLFHAFLLGWGRYGSLILANPTQIAKKEAIFYMGVPLRSCSLRWGCVRDTCLCRIGHKHAFERNPSIGGIAHVVGG